MVMAIVTKGMEKKRLVDQAELPRSFGENGTGFFPGVLRRIPRDPLSSFFSVKATGYIRQVGRWTSSWRYWLAVVYPRRRQPNRCTSSDENSRASSARYRSPSPRAASGTQFVEIRPISGRDARAPLVAQPTAVTVSPHFAQSQHNSFSYRAARFRFASSVAYIYIYIHISYIHSKSEFRVLWTSAASASTAPIFFPSGVLARADFSSLSLFVSLSVAPRARAFFAVK